jgi:hypothetical protein
MRSSRCPFGRLLGRNWKRCAVCPARCTKGGVSGTLIVSTVEALKSPSDRVDLVVVVVSRARSIVGRWTIVSPRRNVVSRGLSVEPRAWCAAKAVA